MKISEFTKKMTTKERKIFKDLLGEATRKDLVALFLSPSTTKEEYDLIEYYLRKTEQIKG